MKFKPNDVVMLRAPAWPLNEWTLFYVARQAGFIIDDPGETIVFTKIEEADGWGYTDICVDGKDLIKIGEI